jgi:hypothetical protein
MHHEFTPEGAMVNKVRYKEVVLWNPVQLKHLKMSEAKDKFHTLKFPGTSVIS